MNDPVVDYQGNSKKDREKARPEKKIEKVVTGEVIVPKKSLGAKVKNLFVEADFKTVARYVFYDVLIPAARNMIVDASTKGVERMMYGESSARRRMYGGGNGPRITYNNPINRGPLRELRTAPPVRSAVRPGRDEIVLASREEADLVLERLNDIIETYDVASVADLNELVGLPTSHIDNKWGWVYVGDAHVRQIREGYLIDLPPAEPIQ